MSKTRYIAISLLGALLLTGCDHEESEPADNRQRDIVRVIPLAASLLDVEPWDGNSRATGNQADSCANDRWSVTRAGNLPDGYQPFSLLTPQIAAANATIGIFLTPEKTSALGSFAYMGTDLAPSNNWKSTVGVFNETQYYIYGFMPKEAAESATIEALDGDDDYSKGAVLTVRNFPTLTAADACVIVGVRNGTSTEDITSLESPLLRGSFGYTGQAVGQNRMFLLLKHIYSGLRFKLTIDPEYHALRTIKLKKMELTAKSAPRKVTMTLTLTANDTGADPLTNITYDTSTSPAGDTKIELYPGGSSGLTTPELDIPETTPAGFMGCYVPGNCKLFELTSTYDVYDRKGNLIRQNCTATNTINTSTFSSYGMTSAGEVYTINLQVKPTYLYVLSEPDLDNPTMKIEN